MEPATPQGTSGNPSSTARRHRTLQAVLLFFLVLLLVLIGAMLTGAFGAKTTVSSTQATATANARAGLSGSFANGGDGSVVLPGTITAGASLTPISRTPGADQNGGAAASSASGNPGSAADGANGAANGSQPGGSSGTADGSATGNGSGSGVNGSSTGNANGDTTGSLPGGTNSNPSGSAANGSSTGGSTGGSTGNANGGSTGGSGLAGSLPGGSNSTAPGGVTGSSTGSSNGGVTGSSNGGANGAAGSGGNAANLPTPHLGNYVCTTGGSGNLTYQSDFTILDGLKYKHSSNPSQEFSFTYDPNTQAIHWLDGPNAGTVGAYYLPDGAQPYRIVEQFPNNPQATPISCRLAETK
jgi:hypothetical protein